jgi:hypothetical protein
VRPMNISPQRCARPAVRLLCCLLLAHAAAASAGAADPPLDYHLGDGLRIPGTGWTLGGYATGSYNDLSDAAPRANLDNLSLFVWWEGQSRWKLFSEIEYENFAVTRRATGGRDDYVSLERLYVDYALTDTADIRGGKFLTPIGRWNLIHATPLVWTTSRPLTTTRAFPTNMTGLMLTGTLPSVANGLEYTLYGASTGDLRPNPDQDPFATALGVHVTLPLSQRGQLGFSYANFEQRHTRPERKQLVGLDYFWTRDRWELSAEAVYRSSGFGGHADEKGAFVQLAAPLTDRLYAVGRAEVYRGALQPHDTELFVAGLTFRISRALVLKAEWIDGNHNTIHAPTGFMSSISILL